MKFIRKDVNDDEERKEGRRKGGNSGYTDIKIKIIEKEGLEGPRSNASVFRWRDGQAYL